MYDDFFLDKECEFMIKEQEFMMKSRSLTGRKGVYAQKLFVESGSLTYNGVCFSSFFRLSGA